MRREIFSTEIFSCVRLFLIGTVVGIIALIACYFLSEFTAKKTLYVSREEMLELEKIRTAKKEFGLAEKELFCGKVAEALRLIPGLAAKYGGMRIRILYTDGTPGEEASSITREVHSDLIRELRCAP